MTMGIVFTSILSLVTMIGMLWMADEIGFLEEISIRNIIRTLLCLSAAIMNLIILAAAASVKL